MGYLVDYRGLEVHCDTPEEALELATLISRSSLKPTPLGIESWLERRVVLAQQVEAVKGK